MSFLRLESILMRGGTTSCPRTRLVSTLWLLGPWVQEPIQVLEGGAQERDHCVPWRFWEHGSPPSPPRFVFPPSLFLPVPKSHAYGRAGAGAPLMEGQR